MTTATRSEFFAETEAAKPKRPFQLPSGKVVYIAEASALDLMQARLESASARKSPDDDDPYFVARLAVRVIVGEDDKPVFDLADCERLMRGKSSIISRLTDDVLEMAGLKEDAKKNSATAPTSISPTVSPGSSANGTPSECLPTCPQPCSTVG